MKNFARLLPMVLALAACGGGGGSGTPSSVDSTSLENQCAVPRAATVINPATKAPYGDVQGSLTTEKSWVRAFVDETYLWYQEVVAPDPALFVVGGKANYIDPSNNAANPVTLTSNDEVMTTYFSNLRTTQLTASGKPKDQYHFTYKTDLWQALSSGGSTLGFGATLAFLATSPPRQILVAYTEPGSPAAVNGITRGAQIVSVNGVQVLDGAPAPLNEALANPIAGKQYSIEVLDPGATITRTVVLTASSVTQTPVQNVRTLPSPYNKVGYLQFNAHVGTAESALAAAVKQLKAANGGAGITDLVLDLRYNGGGFLSIAGELAYMIAGPTATAGKIFERTVFNDKNPLGASAAGSIEPYYSNAVGFSLAKGSALPYLGLTRLFVLTGKGTCSASESVINGLLGAGVEVIQIGETTCGKPYGFYPQDNCGITYFTIQFKSVNASGFGDYADGFSPGGNGTPSNNLRGCVVKDDFSKALGDPAEARLAAALQYRDTQTCPTAKANAMRLMPAAPDGLALQEPFTPLNNRIYSRRPSRVVAAP